MTEDSPGSSEPAADRIAWWVEPDQRLLFIAVRGGVTDDDLLETVPGIWKECPEVIGYDTVVDARGLTSEGGWTWQALRRIAVDWRAFAQGRDLGKRTAIVTRDNWVALLVGAFILDYRGQKFRAFKDTDSALAWMGR